MALTEAHHIKSTVPDSNHDLTGLFKRRWVYHLLFWILYYLFYASVVAFGIYKIKDPVFYFQLAFLFSFDITIAYFNLYFLMPRFLYEKKYISYGLLLLLALILSALGNMMLKQLYTHLGSQYYSFTSAFNFANISSAIIERFYLIGLTAGLKLSKDWITNMQRMREREKQYLETELNFLKSQIQPHFFFNTLNNLYSLTLKKSDQAPEVVLKLSELMSYMLYESNTDFVPLNKEIAYLQNYMDLEQLRFGKRMEVVFDIDENTDDIKIPPMILILFVENSFKHGAKNNLNKIIIRADIKTENGFLFFNIDNPSKKDIPATASAGIGLKNVKRRLDLLYGDKYQLGMTEKEGRFIVTLKIPV